MATYVLVSGAWHAAWCWERVVPLLHAAGHVVVAPDLVGMTDDGVAPATVTLATWADQVAAVVAGQAAPAILVGHSRGGIVISAPPTRWRRRCWRSAKPPLAAALGRRTLRRGCVADRPSVAAGRCA